MQPMSPNPWSGEVEPSPPTTAPREDLAAYGLTRPEARPGTRRPPVSEWQA